MLLRSGIDQVTGFQLAVGMGSAASAAASSGDWAFSVIGVPFNVLMAGFAGALIALWFLPPVGRWWAALLVGTACAGYATPLLLQLLNYFTGLAIADGRGVAFFAGLSAQFFGTLFFRDGRDIVLGALKTRFGIPTKPSGGDA